MQLAWSLFDKDRSDPKQRIRAEDHPGERAVCPLHGCAVVSRQVGGIWQWIHLSRPPKVRESETE